ncbi:hypothetical protein [Streptomyces sp. NPDC005408]|uniref:hypothetical protein n=1 Tax=Streptomyces sp. NPDC005408 TaxID=3155341 RepID=UPI00339E4D25
MSKSGTDTGTRARLRPVQVAGIGVLLSLAALGERLLGGREYIFCHVSPSVDHFTNVALFLVLAAFLSAVAAGFLLAWLKPRTVLPSVVCVIAVIGLVVAADGVDAHGERAARRVAAQGWSEGVCDYVVPTYSVTPGWFW